MARVPLKNLIDGYRKCIEVRNQLVEEYNKIKTRDIGLNPSVGMSTPDASNIHILVNMVKAEIDELKRLIEEQKNTYVDSSTEEHILRVFRELNINIE